VAFTNVSDYDATVFQIVKKGYGSISEIEQWDSERFLDVVEFEMIQSDIEAYHYQTKG